MALENSDNESEVTRAFGAARTSVELAYRRLTAMLAEQVAPPLKRIMQRLPNETRVAIRELESVLPVADISHRDEFQELSEAGDSYTIDLPGHVVAVVAFDGPTARIVELLDSDAVSRIRQRYSDKQT